MLIKKRLYNVRHWLTFSGDRKYIAGGYAYSLKDWERITSNTVKDKQLKALRAILNENEVPPSRYPFGKVKQSIPSGNGRKIALSKDIIGLIA